MKLDYFEAVIIIQWFNFIVEESNSMKMAQQLPNTPI